MDKVKVNNQVVVMRKFVKQGKVRLINKLVKDIKRLQTKRGSEAQVEKNKRKSERLLAIVEIIKKVNVDIVSKMALLSEKNWQEILQSKTATLEERAFALLANYEAVQVEVKTFREKNSQLIAALPGFMKMWEERKQLGGKKTETFKAADLRLKKKARKNKNFGQIKAVKGFNKNQVPIQQDDRFNNRSLSKMDTSQTTLFSNNSRMLESNAHTGKEETEDLQENSELSEPKQDETADRKEVECDRSSVNEAIQTVSKRKRQKEVASINLECLKEQEEILVQEMSSDEDSDGSKEADEVEVKKDPFFMRGGESSSEENVDNSPTDVQTRVKQEFKSREKFSNNSSFKGKDFRFGERKPAIHRDQKWKYNDRKHSTFDRSFTGQQFRNTKTGAKFHDKDSSRGRFPKNFERRNMPLNTHKFEKGNNSLKPQRQFSSQTGKKDVELKRHQVSKDSDSALHPSWAAKRKMKMQETSIAPFKGSKIKFDD